MLIRGFIDRVCATKENSRKKLDRGTSPLVFLSKILIRGAPRILGHSVCNKRKLKKDQRDKSPSLSLQDADKRILGHSVCNKRKLKKDQRNKSPSLSLQDADKRLS